MNKYLNARACYGVSVAKFAHILSMPKISSTFEARKQHQKDED